MKLNSGARILVLSATFALLLLFVFFAFYAVATTIQIPNVQQPLPGTARGWPLSFYYEYSPPNCPSYVPNMYCTPPARTFTLSMVNASLDYLFWFAIALLFVTVFSVTLSRKPAEQKEIEQTGQPINA